MLKSCHKVKKKKKNKQTNFPWLSLSKENNNYYWKHFEWKKKNQRHMLHSNFVTVPVTPFPAHWRTYSGTCEKWHNLKRLALYPLEYVLHMPWRHLLQNTHKNSPFSIGTVPLCITHANGGNPPKRVHQLALCLRATPAPGLIKGVF